MGISRFLVWGGICFAPAAAAFSLFDTAPTIGLPESYPVRWGVSLSAGYDTNVNAVRKSDPNYKASSFVRFGINSSYSDQDSLTSLAYNLNLGGTLYTENVSGSSNQLMSNSSLSLSLSRRFDSTLSYTTSNSLSYTPEPDYATGISASNRQGEAFNYSTSHTISKALDARWSLSTTASYSGVMYSNKEYQQDDRNYVSLSESVSLRVSSRTSYSLTASAQVVDRNAGLDANNIYLNVGVNHSLSPISSCNLTVGSQMKNQDSVQDEWSPTLNAGYTRTVAGRLNINSYVALSNESVGTYRSGRNYASDQCWRMGVNCSQPLTHVLSLTYGASAIFSHYSMGQGGLPTNSEATYNLNCGFTLRHTSQLSSSLTYAYTHGRTWDNKYARNVWSYSLSYSF